MTEKTEFDLNFAARIEHEIFHGFRATADFLDAATFWSRMADPLVSDSYTRSIAMKGMRTMMDKRYPGHDFFEWCKENPGKVLLIEVAEQEKLETGDTYEVTFEMKYVNKTRQYQFAVNEA